MRHHKLLLVTIFILLCFNSQNFAQANNSLSVNQIDGLEFDKKETFLLCPVDAQFGFNHEEPIIEVRTKVSEQSQNLKYKYAVSGGRIIGTGAKVSWDLNKMPPGFYKITVNVSDEVLQREFVKEIQLKAPGHCSISCSCPTLSIVSAPVIIKEGKTAVFTAQVRGGSQTSITYNWTVSEGEISKGQGTSKIQIKTKGLKSRKIVATVEIKGDLCSECERMANAMVEIN